ncbi:MAG: glycosyltransferase family 2 protein [Candidatus Bathyarchaeia archaeon]
MVEISRAFPRQAKENTGVSVVILTRNSEPTLEACLRSVRREGPGEVLAVDTGSTDRTLKILTHYGVRVLSCPSASLGYCRQLGVENATGEFVMFVDSDVEVGRDCLRVLRSELEENGWAGIHAHILSKENATYWQRSEDKVRRLFFNRAGPRAFILTRGALYKRSLVLSHSLDTRMRGAEDVDLCLRLTRDKYVFGVSTSRAVIYHLHRRELSEFAIQRFNYGRYGGARLFRKYRWSRMLLYPFYNLYSALYYALKYRSPDLVPYWVVTCLCYFAGLVVGLLSMSSEDFDSPGFIESDWAVSLNK